MWLLFLIRKHDQLPPPDEVDESYELFRDRRAIYWAVSVMLVVATAICRGCGGISSEGEEPWEKRAESVQTVEERRQVAARFCDDKCFQCILSFPSADFSPACVCGNPVLPPAASDWQKSETGLSKLRLHYQSRFHSDIGVTLVDGWSAEQPVCNPTWFLRNEAAGKILRSEKRDIIFKNGCTGRVSVIRYELPGRHGVEKYSGTMLYGFSDGSTLYANRWQYWKSAWRQQLSIRQQLSDVLLVVNMQHASGFDVSNELFGFAISFLNQLEAVIPLPEEDHNQP